VSALTEAIKARLEIEFTYDGHHRVVRPAAHGTHIDTGNESLRGYQVAGTSKTRMPPLWDMFTVSKIVNLKVTQRRFDEDPEFYKRGDKHMGTIFAEL